MLPNFPGCSLMLSIEQVYRYVKTLANELQEFCKSDIFQLVAKIIQYTGMSLALTCVSVYEL